MSYFQGKNQSLGFTFSSFTSLIQNRLQVFIADYRLALNLSSADLITTLVFTLVLIFGLILAIKTRRHLSLLKLSLTILLLFYVSLLLYPGEVWPWYRALMPFFFLVLSAISLTCIFSFTPSLKLQPWHRLLLITSVLYLLFFALTTINPQTRLQVLTGNFVGDQATVRNQQLALDFIYQQAHNQPFALYVYTPPIYPYIWDYQLYRYAQPKYHYLPHPYNVYLQTGNPKLVFLLIETGDYLPDRITSWHKQFEAYGSLQSQWQPHPSFIIELWQLHSEPSNPRPLLRRVNLID